MQYVVVCIILLSLYESRHPETQLLEIIGLQMENGYFEVHGVTQVVNLELLAASRFPSYLSHFYCQPLVKARQKIMCKIRATYTKLSAFLFCKEFNGQQCNENVSLFLTKTVPSTHV